MVNPQISILRSSEKLLSIIQYLYCISLQFQERTLPAFPWRTMDVWIKQMRRYSNNVPQLKVFVQKKNYNLPGWPLLRIYVCQPGHFCEQFLFYGCQPNHLACQYNSYRFWAKENAKLLYWWEQNKTEI